MSVCAVPVCPTNQLATRPSQRDPLQLGFLAHFGGLSGRFPPGFRHRRVEFRDGAAAPQSAMMISGERKLRCRPRKLTAEFGIAGILDFVETEHGLVKAAVSLDGISGELYLQGAHLTAWQPPGERPVLFTSPNSAFAPGRAIRGGIPIIFPWFGANRHAPAAPQHGFARTAHLAPRQGRNRRPRVADHDPQSMATAMSPRRSGRRRFAGSTP